MQQSLQLAQGHIISILSIPCSYASCNDCCIMHSTSAGADPQLVSGGSGWSCMLLLHPVPTSADAGPDLCTLHFDLCILCLWWLPPAATCGGGVSPSAIATDAPLAHVVLSPIATCAGGIFPGVSFPETGADNKLTLEQLALCGGDILVVL